jgi:hypothetical protein
MAQNAKMHVILGAVLVRPCRLLLAMLLCRLPTSVRSCARDRTQNNNYNNKTTTTNNNKQKQTAKRTQHKPHTYADCGLRLRFFVFVFRRHGWVTDAELAERQRNGSIGLSEGTRNGLAALGEGTIEELDEAAELAASGHWREVRRLCMCTAARDPHRAGSPARAFKRAIANVRRCVRVANVRSLHQVLEACAPSRGLKVVCE